VSLAPYEEAQHTAVIASVALSVIVLIVVAFVTRWILATALRPVSSMTASVRDWSEHDLDRRFDLGPPHDELTELAETLDRMLDRNATALRREQRLTAEISHELRTPLARIATQSELALRRDRQPEQYRTVLATVRRNATVMTRIIDTLLTAARASAGTHPESASATEIAQRAADAAAELARANGVDLVVEVVDGDSLVAADVDLATRVLSPLIDNACRYGRTRATITVGRDGRDVVFTIEDDGQGVDAAERDQIFLPGVRGDRATATPGAGLGLALARRLADSVGGTIDAIPGSTGDFVVRMPTPA
jgi:two-component system, OmpR family, sensor kinase